TKTSVVNKISPTPSLSPPSKEYAEVLATDLKESIQELIKDSIIKDFYEYCHKTIKVNTCQKVSDLRSSFLTLKKKLKPVRKAHNLDDFRNTMDDVLNLCNIKSPTYKKAINHMNFL